MEEDILSNSMLPFAACGESPESYFLSPKNSMCIEDIKCENISELFNFWVWISIMQCSHYPITKIIWVTNINWKKKVI